MIKLRLSAGDLLNIGSALVATSIIMAGFYFFSPAKPIDRLSPVLADINRSQSLIGAQIDDVHKLTGEFAQQVKQFKLILEKIEQLPDDRDLRLLVAAYRTEIDHLNGRFAKLEGIIIQAPDKVLSQAFLKRDLDELKRAAEERITTINLSIDRLNSLFMWAFGGVIFAILGQGIGSFFSRSTRLRPSDKKTEESA